MRKLLFLLTLFFVSFIETSFATGSRFKRINVADGLSQSWVRSIEQDSLGFMWFGTSDGLNKYDGYTFTIFKNDFSNPNSLINNHVHTLKLDNKNRLWVGTVAGLCFFNAELNTFETLPDIPLTTINTLFYSNTKLFIGTYQGLFVYDTQKEALLDKISRKVNKDLRSRNVYSLEMDGDNNLWIGTDEGLYLYALSTDVLHSETGLGKKILVDQRITSLKLDQQQRMWIGTEETGLYLLKNLNGKLESDKLIHFKNDGKKDSSLTSGTIMALKEDKRGHLWIGSENGGLDMIDLTHFDIKNPTFHHNYFEASNVTSLSNNSIYSIFEDFRGDIWVGTYGDGLNFLNRDGEDFTNLFHIPQNKNSLAHSFVNAVKKYGDELWVGTEGGLSVVNMKTNQYRHYQHLEGDETSLSVDAVMSLYQDTDENMWVGTWAGGLNKLNKGSNTFEHFKHTHAANSLGAENVFNITQDDRGNLWFAIMDGGLNYQKKGSNTFGAIHANKENGKGLPSDWIRDVCIDGQTLWFSTDRSVGNFDLSTGTIKNYFPNRGVANSLNGNGAFDIFKDSKGTIWMGTDAGLNYFDNERQQFKAYLESDGLPNNSVKSIQEDDNGNIWLGTNKGLSKFVDGTQKPEKPTFVNYDFNDGLQGQEFNRRAAFKDEQGYLYFGGANGLSIFHPDSLKHNNVAPKLVFTNFEVNNKPVVIGGENSPLKKHISFTKNLTLTHHHALFTIEYAALSFVGKEKNQYEYMLEGFETVWNKVGTQRNATFTNLDAGDYIFKVRGCNNNGVWCQKPLELYIKVLPPWWKSVYALVAYLLLLLTSIFLFIRISMARLKGQQNLMLEREQRKQLEELNQRKLQFFTNISHEFRTPLTLIYSPLEDILRNQQERLPSDLKQRFSIIYKNALRLNRLIGELMDFRKIQFNKLVPVVYNQDLSQFVKNTADLFSQEAEDNQIHLEVLNSEEGLKAWFDPSMIEKVLFNLISNAFKVTPEHGSIQITLYKTKEKPDVSTDAGLLWTCISVKDTGPGLNEDEILKIFDRFYHSDEHTKTYYSSTGIGLSLARNFMDLHKGYLTVKSTEGDGAEFVIWLREGKAHYKKEQVKEEVYELKEQNVEVEFNAVNEEVLEGKATQKQSILVVEDNAELRKYLKTELKQQFKVWTARNGDEGLEQALKYFPDILISDINMPLKNGYELCDDIKSNVKLSHIPVILLTARGGVDDQVKGLDSGADAFIVKPFNIRILKAKVRQLINSRNLLMEKYSTDLKLMTEDKDIGSLDRNFLKAVNQYILDNISDSELSVEQLGDKMAISRSQLYRKIKALSGKSANEYIRNLRLETARKYIITKKYSINEVVYKVGFSSPSYFSKCYKEYFGKLPSEE